MLRSPTAALALAFLAVAPAIAQAAERAPRVALAAFDDEVGLDPRAIADMVVALHGAALEEGVAVVSLGDGALPECDAPCRDDLAAELGADVVLSGRVSAAGPALRVALELRRIDAAEPFEAVDATAEDTAALVAAAEEIGRGLWLSLRPDAAGRAPTIVRRTPGRDGYHGDRHDIHAATPPYSRRSPGLAVVLEILFPGAGLVYAGDWGAVGLEYVGIFSGFLLVMSSIEFDEDGGADAFGIGLGLALMVGSRVYAIIRAPVAANSYNRDMQREWEEQHHGRLERLELRAPNIGLPAPAFTAFELPALTF